MNFLRIYRNLDNTVEILCNYSRNWETIRSKIETFVLPRAAKGWRVRHATSQSEELYTKPFEEASIFP